jgi:aminoglycoside phosphotransferase (APT) family kinase protein
MPVPRVLEVDLGEPRIVMSFIEGRHGQELIDEGQAPFVLRLVGHALADLQAVPIGSVSLEGAGSVIVHGDFGPQNMLFDVPDERVAAIFDWESAHIGQPVEDLSWAEWIVRTHHPSAVESLPELFGAAGLEPPWPERHKAMVDQCESILRYCRSAGFERSSRDWERLLDATSSWDE